MWNLEKLAVATLPVQPPLHVDAVGGKPIVLRLGSTKISLDAVQDAPGESSGVESPGDGSGKPVEPVVLPTCDEQFVRGDQWHLNYPQGDGDYAIRLMLGLVPNQWDATIIECEVSVQTDLLDLHPQIDLVVDAGLVPVAGGQRDATTARIFRLAGDDVHAAILLGPHDFPHTSTIQNQSNPDDHLAGGTTLRLFGEFLEKGVIRRAHPWLVLGESLTDETLQSIWDQLASSPLPLD